MRGKWRCNYKNELKRKNNNTKWWKMHYKITIFWAFAPYPRLIYSIASLIPQGKKDDMSSQSGPGDNYHEYSRCRSLRTWFQDICCLYRYLYINLFQFPQINCSFYFSLFLPPFLALARMFTVSPPPKRLINHITQYKRVKLRK